MNEIFDFLNAAMTATPQAIKTLMAVVTAASALTAITKTPSDDKFIGKLYGILELLALNIGHAKDSPPNRKKRGDV